MKTFATLFGAAMALVVHGAFATAHAINASGHCTAMTVTDFVSSDAQDNTTSMLWTNVTDARLSSSTPNTGCAVITFSADATVSPPQNGNEKLRIRTLLDGNQLCAPALINDIFYASAISFADGIAGSLTHVCKNVAAGIHTLQVQFRSDQGHNVELFGHTLTVTHN